MKSLLRAFLFLLVISIQFNACKTTKNEVDSKPNILFFLIDDQRNDMMGCAGHPILQTPTIDHLAQKGLRFTNAFVTTSICAASRASILSGLYESKHNYTFGKDPIKSEFMAKSYPLLLKQAGYNTGFIGKLGVRLQNQDSLLGQMFDYYKPSPKSVPHFVELPDGSTLHSAEVKGDEAIEFIRNNTNEKPFCLSISFNAVHAVDYDMTPGNDGHYPYPKAVAHLYEDIEMPKPELSDPEFYDSHPEFLKNSLNRERYFWRWDTEVKYQENMKAYFRMISGYDHVMNRVMDALKEKGLDENTIIIFSADNGYYMGNRGFAGKWSHYEESLRVPLIIYDPRSNNEADNRESDEMVLNIDIPATIVDLANIDLPVLYQGKSLVPIIEMQLLDEWRTDFLCEHRMDHEKIPKYVGLRSERYVYANYFEQEPVFEYLHDLYNDPNQLTNLVNDVKYIDILKKMRSRCFSLESEIRL